MSNIITARDIDMVTSDIRYAQRQGARQLLSNLIEIGRLLVEAKSMVPHGEWGKYLEEKVDYSQSTANNLMKLYQEYGDNQESFFGSFANSQAFGNLSYTQALALLALPAEERQEFAETHDVADMSTRQLEQAIRERNAERQAREDAERAKAEAEEKAQQQADAAERAGAEADQLRSQVTKAQEAQTAATQKVEKLQKQLDKAKENEKAAKDALAKAKENPEVPESVMEQLRQEVAADAAKKATEDLQKQLDTAQQQAAVATAKAQEAEQKLSAAQKAAKLSNPETAVFQVLSNRFVDEFNRVHGQLLKVQQSDPDTGIKLQTAMLDTIDKMRGMIAGG